MIMRVKPIGLWLLPKVLVLGTGCLLVGFTGSLGCSPSPKVWVEVTEELRIDTANLTTLQVRTHNGAIIHTGRSEADPTAIAVVTKRAGGATQADADAALAAIQIVSEAGDDGTYRLGWKWSPAKRRGWGAKVRFEIQARDSLGFDGETHNGRIEVAGVTADVQAVSHNGRLDVKSSGGKLYAETHSGRIDAAYEGADITLLTHNGKVVADLSRCGALSGSITTHNGGLEVVLGRAASVKLNCETHNGRIKADVPLQQTLTTRRKLTAVIGDGDGHLRLSTHNGSIRIKKAAG